MKYWENGFYINQNANNTRLELTDEYWVELLEKQSQGYEIKEINGEVVTVKKELTQTEKNDIRINELKAWFDNEYTYKEQKFRRLQMLAKTDAEKEEHAAELLQLYEKAEEVRAEIQSLGG